MAGRALHSTAAPKGCAAFPSAGALPSPPAACAGSSPARVSAVSFPAFPRLLLWSCSLHKLCLFSALACPKFFYLKKKKKKKNSTFLLFQGHKGEQFNDIVALQKVFQMTCPCMHLDWFHTRRSLAGAGAPQCPALPPPLGSAEPTPCCPALESKVLSPSPKSRAGLFPVLARAVQGRLSPKALKKARWQVTQPRCLGHSFAN